MKSVGNKAITIGVTIFATLAMIGFAAPIFATSLPGAQIVQTKITVGDTSQPFAIADTNYLQGGHMQVPHQSDMYAITPQRRSVGMLVTVTDNNGDGSNHAVTYRLVKNPDGGAGCPGSTSYVTDNSNDGLDEPVSCTTSQSSDWNIVIPDLSTLTSGLVFETDGAGNVIATTTSGGGGGGGLSGVSYSTSPNANGGFISGTSTLVLTAANASDPGLVSTGSQSFGGTKTFSQIGIGTTSPGAALEVVGNIISKGTSWKNQSVSFFPSTGITYGNGLFVRTTSNGYFVRSPDGVNWTNSSPTGVGLTGIAYGNGLFVAVTGTSTVFTSVDGGMTWASHIGPSPRAWTSVTYGNGLFVAVASDGTSSNDVMTSPDGITWTSRTSTFASQWFGVTYGNGLYVAVAYAGAATSSVMTSTDGFTWTARTSPNSLNYLKSVTYGNGLFVATGGAGTTQSSPDGITWTGGALPSGGNQATGIAYGDGVFISVGPDISTSTQFALSTDGINWAAQNIASSHSWTGVAYGNGTFVAIASDGTVMTSGTPNSSSVQNNNLYQGGITVNGNDNFFGTPPTATSSGLISIGNGGFAGGLNSFIGSASGTDLAINTATSFTGNLLDLQVGGVSKLKIDSFGNETLAGILTASSATLGSLEVDGNIISKGINWTVHPSTASSGAWSNTAYGNGLFVAVEASGSDHVMTSSDGVNWVTHPSTAPSGNWENVTYGNGLFVAVESGGSNHVMTSPDGINWTAHSGAPSSSWSGLVYGNGLFVAVDDGGSNHVMTSPDGINWTAHSGAPSGLWESVTYANGLFVAVEFGGSNHVMTSPDGINWTGHSSTAPSGNWNKVTYGNGLFVAVESSGTNHVMTSPDGINWTGHSSTAPIGSWNSVTYGSGLFVAVEFGGSNHVMTSPDAINWIVRSNAPSGNWENVTYGNGTFVALEISGSNHVMTSGTPDYSSVQNNNIYQGGITVNGNDNFFGTPIATSTNGLLSIGDGGFSGLVNNFAGSSLGTDIAVNTATSFTGNLIDLQVGGNSKFSVDANGNISSAGTILTAGTLWTQRTVPTSDTWNDVTYGNGRFVAVGSGQVMTSPDGLTWTTTGALTNQWTNIAYGNGLFVAGTWNGATSTGIMTSSNGLNWTYRNATYHQDWTCGIAYGNGQFVACSASGSTNTEIMSSSDGINWSARTAPNVTSLSDITYGNGLFVIVASTASTTDILTSPDGVTWTPRVAPVANTWQNVTYGNGRFVAVSSNGTGANQIMTSVDGITWVSANSSPITNGWIGVTYGKGLFVAVASTGSPGVNQVITSPDGLNWTQRIAPSYSTWDAIAYGNGVFVVMGNSTSTIMTSGVPDNESVQNNNIYQGGITINGNDSFFGAPSAATSSGLISIGDGGFGAVLNGFVGSATGTYLALNATSTFSGDLLNFEVASSSKFKIDATGNLTNAGGINAGGGGFIYTSGTSPTFLAKTNTFEVKSATATSGSPTYLHIDTSTSTTGNVTLGDSSGANGGVFGIYKSSGPSSWFSTLKEKATGGGFNTYFDVSPSTNTYYLGDANLAYNGTFINIDDSVSGGETITDRAKAVVFTATSGVPYFQADTNNKNYKFGDISGTYGSGNYLDIEDSGASSTTSINANIASAFNVKAGGINQFSVSATGAITDASLTSNGSVLYTNSVGQFSQTPTFYWDNFNNYLGLGTLNPSANLVIHGNSTSTTAVITSGTTTAFAIDPTNPWTGSAGVVTFTVGGVIINGVGGGFILAGDYYSDQASTGTTDCIQSAGSGGSSFSGYYLSSTGWHFVPGGTLYDHGTTPGCTGAVVGSYPLPTSPLNFTDRIQLGGLLSGGEYPTSKTVFYPITASTSTNQGLYIKFSSFYLGNGGDSYTITVNSAGVPTTMFKLENSLASPIFTIDNTGGISTYNTAGSKFFALAGNSFSSGSGVLTLGDSGFSGSASGTELAINATSTFTGSLLNLELGGASKFKIDATGNMSLPDAVTATSTYALFSIGNGGFTGTGTGHFVGSATGTDFAINATSTFSGNLLDLQTGGNSKFTVAANGAITSYGTSATATFFSIDPVGDKYTLGDFNGFHNGTYLQVNDSATATSGTVTIHNANLIVQGPSGASCTIGTGTATSGAIVAGTGAAVYCSSDQRLKTNISDLSTSSLEKINELRPVTFNWDTDPDGTPSIGFIAQDMQKVYPEFVNINDPQTGYLGVNYAGLVSPIVAAIQEMDLKLEPLTSLDPTQSNSLASLIDTYLANALNGIENIFAAKVQTHELCLDDVCVTKTQLQQLLAQAAILPVIIGPQTGTSTTITTSTSTTDGGDGGTITSTSTTDGSSASSTTSGDDTGTSTVITTDTSTSTDSTSDGSSSSTTSSDDTSITSSSSSTSSGSDSSTDGSSDTTSTTTSSQ